MKKYFFILIAAAAFLLASCGGSPVETGSVTFKIRPPVFNSSRAVTNQIPVFIPNEYKDDGIYACYIAEETRESLEYTAALILYDDSYFIMTYSDSLGHKVMITPEPIQYNAEYTTDPENCSIYSISAEDLHNLMTQLPSFDIETLKIAAVSGGKLYFTGNLSEQGSIGSFMYQQNDSYQIEYGESTGENLPDGIYGNGQGGQPYYEEPSEKTYVQVVLR